MYILLSPPERTLCKWCCLYVSRITAESCQLISLELVVMIGRINWLNWLTFVGDFLSNYFDLLLVL